MKLPALKSKRVMVVLRNLVMAEVLAYLVFMALALAANWGKIYRGIFLSHYIPFEVAEFSGLGLAQLVLIIWVFARSSVEEKDVKEMIEAGEHEKLEFKTSLRWDGKLQQVNKELEKTVMKTIAAFLNSEGGHLVIGVDDHGQPIGLEKDFSSLPKPSADGFENHFNNLFNQMIGPEYRRLVKINFSNVSGKTICLASIEPSQKPAYLKTPTGEDFYIRTGNVSTPLKMSEVTAYLSSWRRHG